MPEGRGDGDMTDKEKEGQGKKRNIAVIPIGWCGHCRFYEGETNGFLTKKGAKTKCWYGICKDRYKKVMIAREVKEGYMGFPEIPNTCRYLKKKG